MRRRCVPDQFVRSGLDLRAGPIVADLIEPGVLGVSRTREFSVGDRLRIVDGPLIVRCSGMEGDEFIPVVERLRAPDRDGIRDRL